MPRKDVRRLKKKVKVRPARRAAAGRKAPVRKAPAREASRAKVVSRPERRATPPRDVSGDGASADRITSYVWRRLHGGNIIAQASPLRGMGSWRVTAYRTTDDAEPVQEMRSFSLLREAHHGADELVRQQFEHTCRTGVCGRWLRWPDE